MEQKIEIGYKNQGTVAMLKKQTISAYYESPGVDDLLRGFPNEVTERMAYYMFMLGYIEGKRAERARRKK